jgi:CRP/FNR family transcriptional regulator
MTSRTSDARITGLVGTLRCCQLFTGLSPEDLAGLAAIARMVTVAQGAYLYRKGDAARGFFVVQSGAVNVHRVSAAGKEQVIHVFRSGESFAEAALTSPTGYPADARALEPSVVLLLPKDEVLRVISQHPQLAIRMIGSLSSHLRVLIGLLDDLTLKDVETRLINWLVKHSNGSAGAIALRGTKRVLAAELGTSSETLSRTLGRLRDRRYISVAAKAITVRDLPALEAILRRNLGEDS